MRTFYISYELRGVKHNTAITANTYLDALKVLFAKLSPRDKQFIKNVQGRMN